jgi:hypothetical protein
MRTLKITLIATVIATLVSFWFGQLGLMQKIWPGHPQAAGFLVCLVTCILVQVMWPKEWLGGQRNK